jgi:hypothetical protein
VPLVGQLWLLVSFSSFASAAEALAGSIAIPEEFVALHQLQELVQISVPASSVLCFCGGAFKCCAISEAEGNEVLIPRIFL